MSEDDVAGTRQRVLELVRAYPGLHLREIARQLETSVALIEYHVPFLIEDGLVERIEDEGLHRLYPAKQPDRRALAAVRDKNRLHIVLMLLDRGPLRHGELVDITGLGKSTLSFHLTRLRKAGVVEKDGRVFCLVDAGDTKRLLDAHNPTPDLVDRFTDVWGDLYG